jgi:hypothetical protein
MLIDPAYEEFLSDLSIDPFYRTIVLSILVLRVQKTDYPILNGKRPIKSLLCELIDPPYHVG